jgi:hypothetical protein
MPSHCLPRPIFFLPSLLLQVDIINADNGIFVTASDFASIRNVAVKVEKPRWVAATQPDNGHHALMIGRSGDVSFR